MGQKGGGWRGVVRVWAPAWRTVMSLAGTWVGGQTCFPPCSGSGSCSQHCGFGYREEPRSRGLPPPTQLSAPGDYPAKRWDLRDPPGLVWWGGGGDSGAAQAAGPGSGESHHSGLLAQGGPKPRNALKTPVGGHPGGTVRGSRRPFQERLLLGLSVLLDQNVEGSRRHSPPPPTPSDIHTGRGSRREGEQGHEYQSPGRVASRPSKLLAMEGPKPKEVPLVQDSQLWTCFAQLH